MELFSALSRELNTACPALELRADEPMSRHTSFRIGGPVPLMALPKSADEAAAAVETAARLGVTPFFMGNGSNLLVADDGAQLFVMKSVDGLGEITLAEAGVMEAGAGALLSRLAVFAKDHGLTGLEFAHGIPGSLGGAVTMNAGAYGGEMARVVRQVTCLTGAGAVETVQGAALGFSYRHSAFSDGARLILSARLALTPGDPEAIAAEMREFAARRKSKQPLEHPSGGSTFKRPPGHFAAALIDRCGLKGLMVGGAQVSEKHAGFVINRGGATCADVVALMARVRAAVREQTGVTLEPELKTLGFTFEKELG